jgi:hypothetical protein
LDQPHMLHLFVTTHPDTSKKEASLLHVTVSSSVAVPADQKKDHPVLEVLGSVTTISNVHGSDSIVALPYQISLQSLPPNSHVQVEMRLEGNSSMEIVAMFLCNHPGY